MKLWLIVDILGYCAACWEDLEQLQNRCQELTQEVENGH